MWYTFNEFFSILGVEHFFQTAIQDQTSYSMYTYNFLVFSTVLVCNKTAKITVIYSSIP